MIAQLVKNPPTMQETLNLSTEPGSIPGSGRFAGEEIGYPPQYSWTSLVAQLAMNLPTMWETWVQSLGGLGRSPGEGKGYPLEYSGLEISMDCIVHGVQKSQTQLSGFHFTSFLPPAPSYRQIARMLGTANHISFP